MFTLVAALRRVRWFHRRLQQTDSGVLTFYSGGTVGLAQGEGSAEDQLARILPVYAQLVPGALEAHNRKAARFYWPSYPYSLGSYACFQPGQYTNFVWENVYIEGERESVNVGNLLFAGEHVSDDYQGYMNGGAQSGRLAAQALLNRLD